MKPFERIVSATDLSDCSATASGYAKAIARRYEAELTILHANTIAPLPRRTPSTSGNLAHATAWQLDGARAALDDYFEKYLSDFPGARRELVTGPAAEMILAASRVLDADLIVLGTRGHSGIKRVVLGSVAESVIRQSDRPVLTVRCSGDGNGAADPGDAPFRSIVCPVDFSRSSAAAFDTAVALASAFDAELTILCVEDRLEGRSGDPDAELNRLRRWIDEVPLPLRATVLLHGGNAAEQVIFHAKKKSADLLVVGTRPSGFTTLGRTTAVLTRQAPCAVLTVPA